MINLHDVSKSYDGVKNAVDHVTLELRPNEIFGFLGPNGAGKSTAIKMICGILEPDTGEITINGFNTQNDPINAKYQFAYIPDSPDTLLRLKGKEYLQFVADVYNVDVAVREERVRDLARTFEMETVLNDQLQSYSHGMRQKMMVMGALLHDPPVWIMDEPMTGLDPRASFLLKEKMRDHADKGNTVLFSTHVLEVAEKICDRLAIIDKGKLLFVGTIEEMREKFAANRSLEEMFLELTDDHNLGF